MAFGGKPFSRCNICSSQGTICYAMYLSPFLPNALVMFLVIEEGSYESTDQSTDLEVLANCCCVWS